MLFDLASLAPSAKNTQPWAFGVIQNKDFLKSISDRAKIFLSNEWGEDNVPPSFKNSNFNIFHNAPTLLVIMCKQVGLFAITDCALAAQNLMLGAHDIGIGTCWIGHSQEFMNTPEVKTELGIPENYTVVAPIIAGYPNNKTDKKEKKPPEIIFYKK